MTQLSDYVKTRIFHFIHLKSFLNPQNSFSKQTWHSASRLRRVSAHGRLRDGASMFAHDICLMFRSKLLITTNPFDESPVWRTIDAYGLLPHIHINSCGQFPVLKHTRPEKQKGSLPKFTKSRILTVYLQELFCDEQKTLLLDIMK